MKSIFRNTHMEKSGKELRRNIRLLATNYFAGDFMCKKECTLPEKAPISDISESGAKLLFCLQPGETFPLAEGDALSFTAEIEFCLIKVSTVIRRIIPAGEDGCIKVAVEFVELDEERAQKIQRAMLSLASSKLRKIRGT